MLKRILPLALASIMLLAACSQAAPAPASSEAAPASSEAAPASEAAAPAEDVSLRILVPTWDDARKELYDVFQKEIVAEFPDYKFEFEEYIDNEKLKTYNGTGDMPDVFFTGEMSVTLPIIEAGNILDLRSAVEGDGFADKYQIKSVIAPYNDGKIYTLNTGADAYYACRFFVNKDLFEQNNVKIPTTFEEMLEAVKAFKAAGIIPMTTQTKDGQGVGMLLWQTMAAIEDPQTVLDFAAGKIGFTDPKVVAAFDKVDQLAKAGAFAPGCTQMDMNESTELFKSKQAAMFTMFTWTIPSIEDVEAGTVEMASFPGLPGDTVQIWGGPLAGYGVYSKTKAPDAAIKVAEWLAFNEAKFFNGKGNNTSIQTGVAVTTDSKLQQAHIDNLVAAKATLPSLSLLYNPEVGAEIKIQGSKILNGEGNAAEVCATLEALRVK